MSEMTEKAVNRNITAEKTKKHFVDSAPWHIEEKPKKVETTPRENKDEQQTTIDAEVHITEKDA